MISGRFQNCLDSSKTLITHYLAWEANTRFLGLSCETVSGGFRKVFTRKKCYLDSFGFLPLWPRGKRVRCIWRTSRRWLLFLVLRWTIEVKEAAPVCCSQKLLSLFHLLQGVNDKSFFVNNNCLIIFLAISLSINPSNFDINNLPIILKAPIYRLLIISFDNIQILRKHSAKSNKKSSNCMEIAEKA